MQAGRGEKNRQAVRVRSRTGKKEGRWEEGGKQTSTGGMWVRDYRQDNVRRILWTRASWQRLKNWGIQFPDRSSWRTSPICVQYSTTIKVDPVCQSVTFQVRFLLFAVYVLLQIGWHKPGSLLRKKQCDDLTTCVSRLPYFLCHHVWLGDTILLFPISHTGFMRATFPSQPHVVQIQRWTPYFRQISCIKSQWCSVSISKNKMMYQPPTIGLEQHIAAHPHKTCARTYTHALQLCCCVGGLQAACVVSIFKCILPRTIKNCLLHAQNVPCHFPSISHGPVWKEEMRKQRSVVM